MEKIMIEESPGFNGALPGGKPIPPKIPPWQNGPPIPMPEDLLGKKGLDAASSKPAQDQVPADPAQEAAQERDPTTQVGEFLETRPAKTLMIRETSGTGKINYGMDWQSKKILMGEVRYLLRTFPDEKRTPMTIATEIITRALEMVDGWNDTKDLPMATTVARWFRLETGTPPSATDPRLDGYQDPSGPLVFLVLDWFVTQAAKLGMGGAEYRIILMLDKGKRTPPLEMPLQEIVRPKDPRRKASQVGPVVLKKRLPPKDNTKPSRTVDEPPPTSTKEMVIGTGICFAIQELCEAVLKGPRTDPEEDYLEDKAGDVRLAESVIALLREYGVYTPSDDDLLRVRVDAVLAQGIGINDYPLQLEAVNADGQKPIDPMEFLRWMARTARETRTA